MPREIRRLGAIGAAVALVLATLGTPSFAATTAHAGRVAHESSRSLTALDRYEKHILKRINLARLAEGLHRVRLVSPCLDRYSERWAAHLATTGDFVHRDQRKVLRGCDLNWVGETIARGTGSSPTDVVTAWLNSPPHRAVIMKPRANRAGVGVRRDGSGRLISVLNFGDTR